MNKEIAFASWLFSQECKFIAGSTDISNLPESSLPEIAFVGRSNVGKSSLINKLTNRLTLARVSHTPGRTKQLNFFSLGDKIMLVDLPGYGYAKASKKEIRGWGNLIYQYLQSRPVLRRVCLLIDSRHGIKESDTVLMRLLDKVAVNYQIVLTKADKCTNEEIAAIIENIKDSAKNYPALHPDIIVTTVRYDCEGIKNLHQEISSFAV